MSLRCTSLPLLTTSPHYLSSPPLLTTSPHSLSSLPLPALTSAPRLRVQLGRAGQGAAGDACCYAEPGPMAGLEGRGGRRRAATLACGVAHVVVALEGGGAVGGLPS